MIGIIGLSAITKTKSLFLKPIFDDSSTDPSDYVIALYSALWAYDGWSSLNLVVGELKDPLKNLPRSLIFGLIIVIVCYLFGNIAYYAELEKSVIISSSSIAMDFGKVVFGVAGGIIIPIVIIGST